MSQWVPFENRAGHIYIPVEIFGEPAWALLDSGASMNVVSENFLERHEGKFSTGQPIVVSGVHGERNAHLINNVELNLLGVDFEMDDLMPMRTDYVDFIIGLSFFNAFIWQIDYPNSRLRIIEHDSLDLKKYANVKLKNARVSQFLKVQVDFDGEYRPWLLLDTGSNGGIFLERSRVEALGWLEKYRSTGGASRGINEEAQVERFTVPLMTFGPYQLENVMVTVPAEGQVTNIEEIGDDWAWGSRIRGNKSEGIAGYDIFKHFVITLDARRSLMHIEVPQ